MPNPDDATSYDFENDDYGLAGPPDKIMVGAEPMTLDDYSYISLHPNDDGTSWRLVTKQGQDAPRNENVQMPENQAQQLLRELRLRARNRPK